MPCIGMELRHPIDAEVRSRLRDAGINQIAVADAIGRSQGWLSRYIKGEGKATIDDVIRIAALLIGIGEQALSDSERELIRAFRKLEEDDRQDVVAYAKHRETLARHAPSKESSAPAARTTPATARKARGRR